MFGYFPNAQKSWLVIKKDLRDDASMIFKGTGINITNEGRRYLGGAIGSNDFICKYIQEKVSGWVREIDTLASIANTQPHAAYAAFTHGLSSKWVYFATTIPDISDLLKPLENTIRTCFLTSLTGQNALSDDMRTLLSLPVRLGGLGIINPSLTSDYHFSSSVMITDPLVSLIRLQSFTYSVTAMTEILQRKVHVRNGRKTVLSNMAQELHSSLPKSLQRCLDVASEKGASTWLTALPLEEHGFVLHKGSFRDALCLRYGWRTSHLPSHCVCEREFSVDHSLNCKCGGYPSIRHNEIRDITAHLITEVCHNVLIEPPLQQLSGEIMSLQSANVQDEARLDIAGFWGCSHQRAFFDVRIFNPFARTYVNSPLSTCHKRNEADKRRNYDERVREVEHGSFTPLIISTPRNISV